MAGNSLVGSANAATTNFMCGPMTHAIELLDLIYTWASYPQLVIMLFG